MTKMLFGARAGILLACVTLLSACATAQTQVEAPAGAQPVAASPAVPVKHDLAEQSAALSKLSFLVGHWVGEARATMPDGSVVVSRSADDIETINAGTILTIRGHAYAPGAAADAAPVSENLGIFTYDDVTDQYELRAYSAGGYSTGKVLSVGDKQAQWLLDTPSGSVRFTAIADGDGWIEMVEKQTGPDAWAPMLEIKFVPKPLKASKAAKKAE